MEVVESLAMLHHKIYTVTSTLIAPSQCIQALLPFLRAKHGALGRIHGSCIMLEPDLAAAHGRAGGLLSRCVLGLGLGPEGREKSRRGVGRGEEGGGGERGDGGDESDV